MSIYDRRFIEPFSNPSREEVAARRRARRRRSIQATRRRILANPETPQWIRDRIQGKWEPQTEEQKREERERSKKLREQDYRRRHTRILKKMELLDSIEDIGGFVIYMYFWEGK